MDFSEATLQEISLQIVEKAKAAAIAIISQERGPETADGGGASVGVGNGLFRVMPRRGNAHFSQTTSPNDETPSECAVGMQDEKRDEESQENLIGNTTEKECQSPAYSANSDSASFVNISLGDPICTEQYKQVEEKLITIFGECEETRSDNDGEERGSSSRACENTEQNTSASDIVAEPQSDGFESKRDFNKANDISIHYYVGHKDVVKSIISCNTIKTTETEHLDISEEPWDFTLHGPLASLQPGGSITPDLSEDENIANNRIVEQVKKIPISKQCDELMFEGGEHLPDIEKDQDKHNVKLSVLQKLDMECLALLQHDQSQETTPELSLQVKGSDISSDKAISGDELTQGEEGCAFYQADKQLTVVESSCDVADGGTDGIISSYHTSLGFSKEQDVDSSINEEPHVNSSSVIPESTLGSIKTLCNQQNLPPSSDSKRSTAAHKGHVEKQHSSPTKIPRSTTRNGQKSGGERSNRRRVPTPRQIGESSPEPSANQTGAGTCRKIKPTKAKIFSKKMDFSHVQSKCGSLDNIKHVPSSGRQVQVVQQKFDFRHVRSRCYTWANGEKKDPANRDQ
uniref:uncharacterized protein n=1 Tax=Myxine glutinosa TaxID=7769 RepID=UPI00358FC0A4